MTGDRVVQRSEPPAPPPPARRAPAVVALLWFAKLLAAGVLAYAAIHKFQGNPGDVTLFTKLGMEPGGRFLIGALEILAAVLILIPQSAIYGAFLGLGVMCGAIIGHLTVIGLGGLQYALLVSAACVTVLYIRRHDAPFIRNLWDH